MSKVTGGMLVARALAGQGVRNVFSLSGNHILSIYDACLSLGIRIVDTRHEAAAAHMADGWARVTGEPGVCLVTAGPGHTNALTGVATAFAAGSPMVLISGSSERVHAGMGAMQEIDQVGLVAPIAKWARQVDNVREIPRFIETAFRQARGGRPGPVHLSIPSDFLEQKVDEVASPSPTARDAVFRPHASPNAVAATIDLLLAAERPVIVAGGGAWWSQAQGALASLLAVARLPLFTIGPARGIVSDENEYCLGSADPVLNAAAKRIVDADVVLVLGKRLDFRLGYGQPPAIGADARVIQVDVAPEEIGRNRAVALGITADVAAFAEQLAEAAGQGRWRALPWREDLRAARRRQEEEWAPLMGSDQEPTHPLRLIGALRDFIGPDTIVTCDGGDFVQYARAALPARRPGRWLRLGPLATLGCAIPFALAAKLAHPEAEVVAITGDGAFGYYAMEFDTALRHDLPFIAVIGNDSAWGIEKGLQAGLYGPERVVGTGLRLTRYDSVVTALGGHGEFVTRPAEIGPALERARRSGLPACVNVAIAGVPSPLTAAFLQRKRAGLG